MKLKIFLFVFILGVQLCLGQSLDTLQEGVSEKHTLEQEYTLSDGTTRTYHKPRFWETITKAPRDFLDTNKNFVAKDHAWYLGGALASTVVLIPADQYITDQSRSWAEKNGLSPDNKYGEFGPLQNIPENVGAGFYLIGNGTTLILLSAGFVTYGWIKDDYRAKATASGLIESLLVSGVFTQSIKRMTGRESPFIAKENGNSGGAWHPFPSFTAYGRDTPHYDAMPSGHLTTIMAGLTIITTHYPEYKWIKPVGYTLITAMSLQMIQSEVHWVSDYPLALFMGYFIGKTIASNRFKETKGIGEVDKKYKIEYFASRRYNYNMLGVAVKF